MTTSRMRALRLSNRTPVCRLVGNEMRMLFGAETSSSGSRSASAATARLQVRSIHQGVNVRPIHMQYLHSMAEASYIPETPPDFLAASMDSMPDASQFGYRVVPLSQECRYTSTATDRDGLFEYYYGDQHQNHYSAGVESSPADSLVPGEFAMRTSDEILDIMESQHEWDAHLEKDSF